MAEQDWFPPILRDQARAMAWFWILAGTITVVLALLGLPSGKRSWIVGEPRPPIGWLGHPNWELLAVGTALIVWNATRLWLKRRRERSARSRP
jgi:hypothetical protein